MRLWVGMYNRFESGVHPCERIGSIVGSAKDHVLSLQDHSQHLRNRISLIKSAIHLHKIEPQNGVSYNPNKPEDPVDIGGISLEDAAGDWGPHKKPLKLLEPKGKEGLIACPSGGPLCEPTTLQGEKNDQAGAVLKWGST
jgi:hypothetical protein